MKEQQLARYQVIAELVRRHAASPFAGSAEPQDLSAYELSCFSQNGEDGVIAEIFQRVGTTNRFFVEFGIEDGREGNSVFLAEVMGWSGLFMEGSDEHYPVLARRYQEHARVQVAKEIVTEANVEGLLARHGVPHDLDLLTIDVDSTDYWIWAALETYRPRVAVIEYNAHLDRSSTLRITQPRDATGGWDGTDFFGASLGALESAAAAKGYRLIHTDLTGVNAFFVREDLASHFGNVVSPRRAPNYFLAGVWHPPSPNPQWIHL